MMASWAVCYSVLLYPMELIFFGSRPAPPWLNAVGSTGLEVFLRFGPGEVFLFVADYDWAII